jgi:hypothetical protein
MRPRDICIQAQALAMAVALEEDSEEEWATAEVEDGEWVTAEVEDGEWAALAPIGNIHP